MRVLVVEDELDTLNEIEDCLRDYDDTIEIESSDNPLRAISMSRTFSFDVALLDIQMPEMSGLELAECLSTMAPGISLIFITAYNNYATEAFELNAVDYILKPLRKERLNKALIKIENELSERLLIKTVPSGETMIRAFGKLVVTSGDQILKWKRRKSCEVFAYLLHQQGTPVHKEKLCEMIWPEYEPLKALTYLQTIMYQLRKNLAEIGSNGITIEYADHCYRLSLNGVRYDVDLFLEACDQALLSDSPSLESLTKAEQLYCGNYLEEEGWVWALGRQQSLVQRYQKVLESIIRLEMRNESKENALYFIQKWAALDTYKNQDFYLSWVENNIGSGAAVKLKAIFDEDEV